MPVSGPTFRGNAPEVQAGRSNASAIFGSLASRLKQFSAGEEDRLDKLVFKKGQEQGRIDAQGKTAITLRDGETIADEAWNIGAKASYIAAIDLDTKENLFRIEAESESDPVAYKAKATAWASGLIEDAPDSLKPILQDNIAESILRGSQRVENGARTAIRKEQSDTLMASYESTERSAIEQAESGDFGSMIKSLEQAELTIEGMLSGGLISKEKAGELLAKLSEDTDKSVVFYEFDEARKSGNGDEFLAKFIDNPPKELTADSISKLSAIMDKSLARDIRIDKRLNAENVAAVAAEKSAMAADLKIALSRGEAGEPEIEKAVQDGTITADQGANHIIALDRSAEKENKTADRMARVVGSISGGDPLSPGNPEHVKGVDELWNGFYADKVDLSTDEGMNVAAEYTESTGIMPKQLVDVVHSHSLSGDTSQAVSASDLLSRINEKSPQVLASVSRQAKAFALSVSKSVSAGTEPEVAVELARMNAYELTKEETQAIKDRTGFGSTEFRDQTRVFLDDMIDDDFDRFTISQPELPVAMEAEFNSLLSSYIGMTKNADQARELAYSDLKSVWAMTEVNGKPEMMKYSPELVYGSGGGAEWIRDQLIKEVKDLGYKGNPMIAVDPRTAREKSPSYLVMVDGEAVVGKDNQPLRWIPNYSASKAGRKSKKEMAEIMENAKQERAANKRNESIATGDNTLMGLGLDY